MYRDVMYVFMSCWGLKVTRVAGKRAILMIGVERLKRIRDILWHKLLLLFC